MADIYYTVDQIAEKLQVKPTTVRKWIKNGLLEGKKMGKRWIISPENLQRYLDGLPG